MEAVKYTNIPGYSYDDYKKWEGSWELIDGLAYAMVPAPHPKHQRIVAKIWQELDKHLICANQNCEAYISPVDWKVDEHTVVQPDVAIFCEAVTHPYFSQTPLLVVEVLSKATALKDVTTKMKLYEREGVGFYIIIDPNNEQGNIFKWVDGKYERAKQVRKEETVPFVFSDACHTQVDFSTLF